MRVNEIRCDAMQHTVVWCGAVQCSLAWCGAVRCGAMWCGAVRCNVMRINANAVRCNAAFALHLRIVERRTEAQMSVPMHVPAAAALTDGACPSPRLRLAAFLRVMGTCVYALSEFRQNGLYSVLPPRYIAIPRNL